jgi:hypothetical protein
MQEALRSTIEDTVNFERKFGGVSHFTLERRAEILEEVANEAKEDFMKGNAKVLVAKPGIK